MDETLIEYHCKRCGKLLLKAEPGAKIEIQCSRSRCKQLNRFNIKDSERLERQ